MWHGRTKQILLTASIVTRLRAGRLKSKGSIPGDSTDFTFLHCVQTDSGGSAKLNQTVTKRSFPLE